jgi:tRNA A37 threonylcarbamoyladenosine synthetase subunit TsaC/SUA5/YrdC
MNDLQQAVGLLIKGEVIVLPVEGTYCYVADPFNEKAVNKLMLLQTQQKQKAQPIMLMGDFEDMPRFVNGFSDTEEQSIMQNWPSDKTICFSEVQMGVNPKLVYSNKKIALRMPSSDYILEVLHAVGQPLASIVVYNENMPAKDKRDLYGIDNFILKLPMSLSGNESQVIE